MTNVISFHSKRQAALTRVQSDIQTMTQVKRGLTSGTPSYILVESILRKLKIKAAKLSSPKRTGRKSIAG
jgi:hypothetical protein